VVLFGIYEFIFRGVFLILVKSMSPLLCFDHILLYTASSKIPKAPIGWHTTATFASIPPQSQHNHFYIFQRAQLGFYYGIWTKWQTQVASTSLLVGGYPEKCQQSWQSE
jgi:hypothetical protein